MERYSSRAIVLARTDFGEADRIITFITPAHGKIRAIAKGVRKSRSKLAGALEIFSVCEVLVLPGKSEVSTLMSAKLVKHYGHIVQNLKSTNAAYEFMRLVNKLTHDKPEEDYYHLLDGGLSGLDQKIQPEICTIWFKAHLLKLTGHQPDLLLDVNGKKLNEAKAFKFDFDKMRFYPGQGKIRAKDIKFLRIALSAATPNVISRVEDAQAYTNKNSPLIASMLEAHLSL